MGFNTRTAGLLGLFSFSLAAPAPQAGGLPAADNNACAAVSQAQAQQRAANPRVLARVPASTALACLQSVPNKPAEAAKLIASTKAYAQWQSTLAWLKDPPPSYMLPPTDIQGGLDAIGANATAGMFQSEFEFQSAIVQLVATAHDGHFSVRPDMFKAFSFRNDLARDIISVSVDGKQVPKLYNLGVLDGTTSIGGTNQTAVNSTNGMPPAIVKINGQDAAQVIEEQGKMINFQDPDSQWNSQFQSYAVPTARTTLASSIFFLGDSVTLEYDNGQKVTQESYAVIRGAADFTGVNTGEDFYQKFCNPANTPPPTAGAGGGGSPAQPPPPPQPTSPPGTMQPPEPAIPGFPMPAIRDSGANITAGYFLQGEGYEDTAVLSVLGFAPLADFDLLEYAANLQKMTESFLAMCKQAGKQKLIIDVTGNGGGLVVAGFELYAQLFPGTPLFQADNMRLTESMEQMARIAAAVQPEVLALDLNNLPGRNATQRQQALAELAQSSVISNLVPGGVFSAADRVKLTSTDQIISPVTIKGDRFTSYISTPLNETASDFNLTGTGNRANPPPAVFDPNNVVILTDGTCGSTCTLFSYLMIMQQNVKTVVVGGRPQTGPMQSIAGVEGAQVFPFNELQQAALATLVLAPPEQQPQLNQSELGVIAEGYLLQRSAVAGDGGAINGKNAFSQADAQTPLQFLMQPAQCRFFYTKDMIYGPEAVWKRAADATFKDPQGLCVEGSITPTMGVQPISDEFFANQPVVIGTSSSRAVTTELLTATEGDRSAADKLRVPVWIAALVVSVVFLI
ncbi:peptidase S41 family protein [Diaporthe helianthi]|uniref:Peptidase S41 family protein n=1 Tax=Diaporthe helianthi TaxID=158607 RepID=A0A2P5I9J9_DIAHE|nr:peptidase S41 family protein [Diaporthe helianthi]